MDSGFPVVSGPEKRRLDELPAKVREQVIGRLSGLAWPHIRLIPYVRQLESPPHVSMVFGGLTAPELAAAAYYEACGHKEMARLDVPA